ncbi:MAG: DUF6933 domain-containing protein [Sulfuricaulis sp.]
MPLLIRCTQKLLAEIPDKLADPLAAGESWHANLLRIERRKCVLFTHDTTLYSIFVPGLKKPEFEHLDEVFGQRLFKALLWDEFSQELIERALEACRTIRFTRSNNRRVLGSMNEMRFHVEVDVEDAGGLDRIDLADLHHRLNRTPWSAVGYRYAVDCISGHLAGP